MADDALRSAPEEPSGPEEVEIELHGEPQPTEEPRGEVLEITQQDLADVSEEGLPAISGLDAAVAEGTANWVDIPAVCSQTGDGFVVRFRQVEPGRFTYAGAEQRRGPQEGSVAGAGRNVKAEFDLSDYPGCPCCGASGLVVCSGCGTVSCGASVRQTKQALVMTCPHCHRDGEVQAGGPGTQVWTIGGLDKKK
ncbi:MAG: hypothetical protein KAW89_02835 [Armatimonadetes bacterium]|nr:hypothetical protein [Armatimonadota bacterium]